MKHLPAWNKLNTVLSLCKKHRFCTVKKTENEISGIKYGALGSQLKRNILNQWTSSIVSNSDVNIFPVESDKLPTSGFSEGPQQHRESLFDDILHHYMDTLPLIGENLPFGLALSQDVSETRCKKSASMIDGEKPFARTTDILSGCHKAFWNPLESTSLVVAFFCSPQKTTDWFHYWQKQRYTWWRKLACVPFRFSISNIEQNTSGHQFVTLQCDFPWGQDMLESVSVSPCIKVDSLDEMTIQSKATNGIKSVLPSVVMCEADLDLAVIAYLSDACEEKLCDGHLKPVLKLHPKLAPYKVSIVITGGSAETAKKLHDLATFQVKELKKSSISTFPNPELATEVPLDMQVQRFDEMGVPYTIILSDISLKYGSAGLRNRDTSLQEEIHITELTSKLLSYLQMKSKIS